MLKKMDAEMKAFAADVLESIKQAKRIESEQIHAQADIAQNSFIKHLEAVPKTPDENADEFEANRLDIQPRTIDLDDSFNNCFID